MLADAAADAARRRTMRRYLPLPALLRAVAEIFHAAAATLSRFH